ncbi:MAG: preprotein translocase subunit SecG [Rhodothalassiaceae bacterium]
MDLVLLIIHLVLACALVGVILLQRSEGGALGMGGGPAGLMSARGAANFLTRLTAWLAAAFLATSLGLAILASESRNGRSILDEAPVEKPVPQDKAPAEPQVPVPD